MVLRELHVTACIHEYKHEIKRLSGDKEMCGIRITTLPKLFFQQNGLRLRSLPPGAPLSLLFGTLVVVNRLVHVAYAYVLASYRDARHREAADGPAV